MSTPASRNRRRSGGLALLLGAQVAAWAAGPASAPPSASDLVPDPAAERQRIAGERAAVESRYRQARDACAGVFAVSACEDQAKKERRQAIERLDAERATLEERLRRERAEERRRDIAQRQAERAAESTTSAAPAAERRPLAAPAPSKPMLAASATRSAEAASTAVRREAEAQARWRERQLQAEQHRLEVERRNAAQDARHAPATGLPVPAASAGR